MSYRFVWEAVRDGHVSYEDFEAWVDEQVQAKFTEDHLAKEDTQPG